MSNKNDDLITHGQLQLSKLWERKDMVAISEYKLDDKLVVKGSTLAKWVVFPWSQNLEPWFTEMRVRMILQFGTQLPQFILADLYGYVNGRCASVIRWEHKKGEPHFMPQAALRLEEGAKKNLEAVYHWTTSEARCMMAQKMAAKTEGGNDA